MTSVDNDTTAHDLYQYTDDQEGFNINTTATLVLPTGAQLLDAATARLQGGAGEGERGVGGSNDVGVGQFMAPLAVAERVA